MFARAGGLLALAVVLAAASPAGAAECPQSEGLVVPGAERQEQACLDELTTAGLAPGRHTDPADWQAIHARGTRNPSGAPGLQIDGYFADDSTLNATHGWHHDSQFVIRLPNDWNGKLVTTGAPGILRQYAHDFVVSDWLVARGYAYASIDKGNSGANFYEDGPEPGDAIAEWGQRVNQLTLAAKDVVRQRYGQMPARTYITGVSNGGYHTRFALERHPELYDGGVDWEGTLFAPGEPNLLSVLRDAVRLYPQYRAGDPSAHAAMIAAGWPPRSEFLWDHHYTAFWDLSLRVYREEIDPDYDGALEGGVPFCQPGMPMCDADWDYESRPAAAQALGKIGLTGDIGKPMLTLHGTLDTLLPPATNADLYTQMVQAAGRADRHRYYVVEDGTHFDSMYDAYPDRLRPILPCYRLAFLALERWVEHSQPPPPSQFVVNPGVGDLANECTTLRPGLAAPGSGPLTGSTKPRLRPAGLTLRVRRARSGRIVAAGRVLLPRTLSQAQACGSGRVRISLHARGVRPVRRYTPLRRDCGFRLAVRVRGRPRSHARATFFGNRALRAISVRRTASGSP